MQEHAIPQDVTGYKFHIVGSMTLGQFAQLVVGAIAAFAIYSTNLYSFIKWPLIFIVVLISVVAAFIPIAERPLSHWITTFFRVLYKPTQFAWRREPKIPEPFLFKPADDTGPVLPELDLTPLRRQRIQEFIATTRMTVGVDPEADQIDGYYTHVFSLFDQENTRGQTSANPIKQPPIQVNKPSLKVRMRSMRANPSTPLSLESALQPDATTSETTSPSPTLDSAMGDVTQPIMITSTRSVELNATPSQNSDDGVGDQNVVVPENSPIEVEANSTTNAPAAPQTEENNLDAIAQSSRLVKQSAPQEDAATSQVTFNKELPFPSKPTTPNKLVGMVLTPKDELIEGAIIEIRTADNQVARAVRSNALGQFYVTTPLKSGDYVLVAEKNGRTFSPLSIQLKGKIVDPIEIRSAA